MIVALIFCVAAWAGVRAVAAFREAGGIQDFYQRRFGPAVMLACGRPFMEPVGDGLTALTQFLAERAASFDCRLLPSDVRTSPLDGFQNSSRYLLYAAAGTWRAAGVSWQGLSLIGGVFFGAVAALTYGVLRLALSRVIALLMLVPAVTSTPNVMLVPQLRDYSKGPFLLAAILIMGWLVTTASDTRRLVALAAAAGAVIGVGIGFRMDLMIAVAPMLLTLAVLLPPSVTVRARAAAMVVFLSVFVAAGFPILRGYAAGRNTGHVTLLGLGAPFDGPLRIEPSIYEFAGQYNDSLAYSIINSYAIRLEQRRVVLGSPEYEQAAGHYLTQLMRVFPADFMTRVVAATRAVPHYFLDTSLFPPLQATGTLSRTFYHLRASALSRLAPFTFAAVVAVIVGLTVAHPRAALLALVVMFGFAGVSALQFHERHFFYLQFVPWLAFGMVGQALVRTRGAYAPPPRDWMVRVLVVDAALVLAAASALFVVRLYQQRAATALFASYEAAPRTELSASYRALPEGRILVTALPWTTALKPGARWIEGGLIAAQFRGDRCGGRSLPIVVRYSGNPPDVDLSESVTVPVRAAAEPTLLVVSTFDRADESIRFRGIELPASLAKCLSTISKVDGLDSTPLLLTVRLAPGWRGDKLFQRLR